MEARGIATAAGAPANPLAAMDGSAPWLAPLAALPAARSACDPVAALNAAARAQAVRTATGLPLQFAPAGAAGATAYEAHIAATGCVPTRRAGPGALHDLFNALIWVTLPATKAALNARQAQEIARAGVGSTRGAVRDACTLLDESGLLLACTDAATADRVRQALAERDWTELFLTRRGDWHARIVPVVLGHALLEKLVRPYKAITAQVIVLECPGAGPTLAQIDPCAARFVQQASLSPAALAPLPVLGVPGWWPENADPGFYDDAQVFRPRRAAQRGVVAA